tara:strand:+ start:4616 stop:5839 length:1224 start_codon:yes stop_codon:yes gene_type:complete
MIDFPEIENLTRKTSSRILFVVVDGLGGYFDDSTNKSELEEARTPNLDKLSRESACGLSIPVDHGITPGSGPGHLALFGYDPIKFQVGRGVLEALGLGFELNENQIAIRGNFALTNNEGVITDRRANRISSDKSTGLIKSLSSITIPSFKINVELIRDHRFLLVLTGENIAPDYYPFVYDTDPGLNGLKPLTCQPTNKATKNIADAINSFVIQAHELLHDNQHANTILLRGISKAPTFPSMQKKYKLSPIGIAAYPMYLGLAKLAGMEIAAKNTGFAEEIESLKSMIELNQHDFFFLHYKPADAAGEDGDRRAKVKALEDFDKSIPDIKNIGADVLVIAGDHSTPAVLASHSWHSVPFLINTSFTKADGQGSFSEREFRNGSLGLIKAKSIMMLALAHAGKLKKFGS